MLKYPIIKCDISEVCETAMSADRHINYVFNCAGETKSGLFDLCYKERIYKVGLHCAQQAAKINVDRYVEISSGHLSSSDKVSLTVAR